MKLRHLLFGLLAGVAFVACTNDDDPAGASPVNGGNKMATADKYISVNMVMPGGATTRTLDGFKEGTTAENAVKKASFLFFKGESQIAEPFTIEAGGNDANGDAWTPGDGKQKAPVIVMKNPTDIPDALVVLINYGGTVSKSQKISDLQAAVADYSSVENGFVMSSSVYYDAAGKLVVGAPVGPENVKDTPAAAKGAPVKAYVERVLAAVTVDKASDAAISSGVEGIDVVIDGWWLAYENTQSNLVKKLSATYNFGTGIATDWINDAANFRSYWADAAAYKAAAATAQAPYSSAASALKATLYTQENTNFWNQKPDKSSTTGNPTVVVVSATLKKGDAAVDLYKLQGIVYDKDNLMNYLAKSATAKKYFKKTSAEGVTPAVYDNLAVTDFVLADPVATAGQSYEASVYLQLASGVSGLYTFDADNKPVAATADAANADLKKAAELVQFFKGGATYYYVPIVQNSALNVNAKDPKAQNPEYLGLFGVVRNHYYQLTIKKVQGLGTAVPDPTQVIVPEEPVDKDYYIAAEINILDWKLVSQDVNLGN